VFLAVGWLRAGVEKVIREDWWNGDDLRLFLDKQHDAALAFWRPVMEHVLFHQAPFVSFVIVTAELLIGAAIALDYGMTLALRAAIVLNVIFVLCGVVNPSAFYLVMEMVLLSASTDRAVGMQPQHSQNRIGYQAIAWFVVAALFAPFIRTVQPAELIADPASMLSLMAAILGATLAYRWWRNHAAFTAIWAAQTDNQGAPP
jgi:hypothetical protein